MKMQSLNGDWMLYYYPNAASPVNTPDALNEAVAHVPAVVPGNAELDLSRAGVLPADLFHGTNLLQAEMYEDYHFWYVKEFEVEEDSDTYKLVFNGADCLAEYFLNGICIGSSENALVPVTLDAAAAIQKGKNKLAVHLKPISDVVQNSEYNTFLTRYTFGLNIESVYIRKPPHAFGWDIMPRAVTAGLWREVNLQIGASTDFKDLLLYVRRIEQTRAVLQLCIDTEMPFAAGKTPVAVCIEGVCGEHRFKVEQNLHFKAGQVSFAVDNPKLWWPYGYGEANLYDMTVTVSRGGVVYATRSFRFGIRTVELERTEYTDKKNIFRFIVNGVPVMCKGSNWVPLDVYHSRDMERMMPAIELMTDIGCNMIRCWGGNVYEPDVFYEECDARGIMVWQDFGMACHAYPQDDAFLKVIEDEAAAVVRRLRNHPCIVLWSGDNENDVGMVNYDGNPDENILTRKLLPEVIKRHDAKRPYLPSSPYVTGAQFEADAVEFAGEDHLWGPRDYFKSSFYKRSKAMFISEIGYHGCPSVESLKKYIDEENLSDIEHPQWVLHSADQRENTARINLLPKQVKQLFGAVPEGLEDFVLASQITQAEAKKFFIEHMRIQKPDASGILWWNLLDGWPQISDAVVDFYFDKKLAYHYIKTSQAPFALMVDEIEDWNQPIVAANDTLQTVSGCFTVKDGETNEVMLSGDFEAPPNANIILGGLPVMYSTHGLLILEWETNLGKGRNHFVCGHPPLDFARYAKWLPMILGE